MVLCPDPNRSSIFLTLNSLGGCIARYVVFLSFLLVVISFGSLSVPHVSSSSCCCCVSFVFVFVAGVSVSSEELVVHSPLCVYGLPCRSEPGVVAAVCLRQLILCCREPSCLVGKVLCKVVPEETSLPPAAQRREEEQSLTCWMWLRKMMSFSCWLRQTQSEAAYVFVYLSKLD